jgi:hypothetical protein
VVSSFQPEAGAAHTFTRADEVVADVKHKWTSVTCAVGGTFGARKATRLSAGPDLAVITRLLPNTPLGRDRRTWVSIWADSLTTPTPATGNEALEAVASAGVSTRTNPSRESPRTAANGRAQVRNVDMGNLVDRQWVPQIRG